MPLDASTPADEIATLCQRFGVTAIVAARGTPGIDTLGDGTRFGDGIVAVHWRGPRPATDPVDGGAALKLTSGSTGLPKAARTLESQLIADSTSIITAMDIRPADCQIAVIPISHAYGLGNLVIPLLLQGTAIVLRDAFVPQQLHLDASRYGARVFPGVPFMFSHFAANPGACAWPRTLASLISAGAPLDTVTAARFHAAFGIKIHPFYGATETGGIAFDDSPTLDRSPTVGRAMPGVAIAIRAEDGAPDGSGRVHVSGPAVASGYAGLPSSTEGFDSSGYLTGDFGRVDDQGFLFLTGRASSFVNVAGRKVQPEEVERVLCGMDGIEDARVIGMPDAVRGQQVVAGVVRRTPGLTATAIRRYCASRVASYKVPRTIVWLDRIPLTARGKTDRARLEASIREALDQTAGNGVL